LPWKRFQLNPWARAGVKTNGPAAAEASAAPPRRSAVRREIVPVVDVVSPCDIGSSFAREFR
jgi:hypothetical protein